MRRQRFSVTEVGNSQTKKRLFLYTYSVEFHMSGRGVARCQELPDIHLFHLLVAGAQI